MTGNIKVMNSDWELAVLTGLVGAVGVRLSVSVPGCVQYVRKATAAA